VKKINKTRNDGKVTMYCIGINKKEIVTGTNKYIVSRQTKHKYPKFASVHAELDFYYRAKKKGFEPSDIYIVGYRTNQLKTTKPCIYCAALLLELRFKRIHFYEDGVMKTLTRSQLQKELNNGLLKTYS